MTFTEYFNGLYPYLSGGKNRLEFFDEMIGSFIKEAAHNSCFLLNCPKDTKGRYIQINNARKIDPKNARYAYSKRNPGYNAWLQDKMGDEDSFADVEDWLTDNGIEFEDVCDSCDKLLQEILFNIAYPEATKGNEVTLPASDEASTEEHSGLEHLSGNDQKLLKSFRIDFDSTLKKCIASDMPEVWFTGRVSEEIENLYNDKWKELIPKISDIRIQSDMLATVATLREFCDALDPDKETSPTLPVRKLREKLRGCYIKIHPNEYVDLLPYEAVIDDWNDFDDSLDL